MPKSGFRRVRIPSLAAIFVALGIPLATGAALAPSPAVSRGAPDSFADLAAQLSPMVVNVSTSQTLKRPHDNVQMPKLPEGSPLDDFFKDFLDKGKNAPRRVTSLGSGFVIDPSGLIVTNNHVIEGADQISVTFNDGSTLPAKVIGHDTKVDVALLKVKAKAPLPFTRFGDSDKARVGEWVMAIGNPFGLGGSVTAGIISARNRDINAGPYDDFIQTDAPINRGNSGGPLFNMQGEVIGVNSAIYSPSGGSVGIAFAIPSAMVKGVVAQLRQFGEMHRGWLGVRIQQVTDDIALSLGLKSAKGALIAGVTPNGPAAKGGIMNGDLVLAFDSKPVADNRALPRMVADEPVGKTVPMEVWRKGARKILQVTLGRLQDVADKSNGDDMGAQTTVKPQPSKAQTPAAKRPASRLGAALAPLNPQLRSHYHIANNVQGVVVTDVDDDSPAADKNIEPGDVIVEVAQEPVKTPADVTAKLEAAAKGARNMVLLLVSRGGELTFVAVNLAKT
jgi:serine protease Do